MEKKIELEDLLRKVFVAITLIFLVIAAWGLYSSLNDFVRVWVDYKFVPIYKALINSVVLIISIYVISLFVKKS